MLKDYQFFVTHIVSSRGENATVSKMLYSFRPVGIIQTCFIEKFGVPRQSMMAMAARGIIKLNPDPQYVESLYQLDSFSHIWVVFLFQNQNKAWRPRIEHPRTGGHKSVGVFASRSPNRPNPIGMSVVKLDKIDLEAKGGIEIHVSGVDLLDGTPILDLKPYLPYADSIPEANSGWASDQIKQYEVSFSPECLAFLESQEAKAYPHLKELVEDLVAWDPRPRSQREAMPLELPENDGKVFRFRIQNFDVEWKNCGGKILMLQMHPLK